LENILIITIKGINNMSIINFFIVMYVSILYNIDKKDKTRIIGGI